MRKVMLGLAAAGALGLTVSAMPANAGVFTGLQIPEVESNTIDVQRRCHHHRWSSRWHCRRWRRHWHHHHYYGPRFYGPGFYHRRYWW
jgi:hypothetical protein